MSTLKEICQRRKTAKIICRMTSAMKVASQAKFSRVQRQLRESILVCEEIKSLASRLMFQIRDRELARDTLPTSPCLQGGPIDAPWLLILITSDNGLCGGFNQRLVKAAQIFLEQNSEKEVEVICIGQKGVGPLQRTMNPKIVQVFTHAQEAGLLPVQEFIMSQFMSRRIQGCSLLYSRFYNILRQEPYVVQLLPMILEDHKAGERVEQGLLSYEPSLEKVLDEVLSLLFSFSFHAFVKEHTLSEHGSRMTAMNGATENAKAMIQQLNISYNHLRQALITKELNEIIAGAELANS